MLSHSHRILIGAAGWLHKDWQSSFYPDDLPADWLLGYYSNEFPVVLIPAATWPGIKTEIHEWLEDSADELLILCEAAPALLAQPADSAVSALQEYIAELSVLAEHLLGVLIPVDHQCPDIASILTNLQSPVPLCIELQYEVSEAELTNLQNICVNKKIGICWHGRSDTTGLSYGQLAVSRIQGKGLNLRELREVVESIVNVTKLEQSSVLIIDGNPPDIETIRNANVILELI